MTKVIGLFSLVCGLALCSNANAQYGVGVGVVVNRSVVVQRPLIVPQQRVVVVAPRTVIVSPRPRQPVRNVINKGRRFVRRVF